MSTNTVSITGTIRWINHSKGFGVITPDVGGKDLFANFPVRKADIPGAVKIKQKVSYEIKPGPDGDLAVNVRAIK